MGSTLVDALWYLGRGTGLVSLVLLTGTVVLGVATRSGRPVAGLPRFGVAALHRSTSLMAVLLIAVHVVSLLFDPYAQLSLVDVFILFQGAYRPLWLGFGTLSLDLLLVIVVTSLLRKRIPVRMWRWVHLSAYAAWPVAVAHGLGNGTDGGQLWFRIVAATCVAAVGVAVVWRLTERFPEHARPVWRAAPPGFLSKPPAPDGAQPTLLAGNEWRAAPPGFLSKLPAPDGAQPALLAGNEWRAAPPGFLSKPLAPDGAQPALLAGNERRAAAPGLLEGTRR